MIGGMDWGPTEVHLTELFDRVTVEISSNFPSIKATKSFASYTPPMKFAGYASFSYDPISQRYEDLILDFKVASNVYWKNPDGSLLWPEGRGKDAILYEIERGTGEPIVPPLGPVFLPIDEEAEYQQMILEAVEQVQKHTFNHLAEILTALKVPYSIDNDS